MKKKIVVSSFCLVVFFLAVVLFADAADDYKVIKNAVKGQGAPAAAGKNAQSFKIVVTGRAGAREEVRISLPISLVEMMIAACPEEKFKVDHGCDVDIRKVWDMLKTAGPMALVEIEADGETVKIWFE